MGTLVTLDLPDDSPALSLPWIITFGPMDDVEDWEPVVCGPYERAHALALAETVIADDEELMAVVEPVQPHSSVEEIREEIAEAKLLAEAEEDEEFAFGDDDVEVSMDAGFDEHADHSHDEEDEDDEEDDEALELEEIEPTAPPSPAEIRAGFARIAARLANVG